MKNILICAICFISICCFATEFTTYRDKNGRIVGTETRSGKYSTYRNANGQVVGYAETNGKYTTYRDKNGKIIGSETRQSNGFTVYRDANGSIIGTSINNKTLNNRRNK